MTGRTRSTPAPATTSLVEPEPEGRDTDNLAPTPEALAAIVAALEELLEAPTEDDDGDPRRPGWRVRPSNAWRFSGRCWSAPAPLRRERPGR